MTEYVLNYISRFSRDVSSRLKRLMGRATTRKACNGKRVAKSEEKALSQNIPLAKKGITHANS